MTIEPSPPRTTRAPTQSPSPHGSGASGAQESEVLYLPRPQTSLLKLTELEVMTLSQDRLDVCSAALVEKHQWPLLGVEDPFCSSSMLACLLLPLVCSGSCCLSGVQRGTD